MNALSDLFPRIRGEVLRLLFGGGEVELHLRDLAFLFGSLAAGNATSGSDADLLVIGSAGLRKLSPTLRQMTETIGREINPVCLTPAEWREKIRGGDAFAARVAAEPKLWLKGGPDALAAMGG